MIGQVEATTLRVASYNMQGWVDTSSGRQDKLASLIRAQNLMNNVSVLMVQESIEDIPRSTTEQLARAMRWKSFSKRRTSDGEGLGFIYPRNTDVVETDVLQLRSRESSSDYSRMAISMQIINKHVGRIRFINTHLAHLSRMAATRKHQLSEILSWVQSLEEQNPSELLIFGGDFNTGPQESYYAGEFKLLTDSSFKFSLAQNYGANFTWIDKKTRNKKMIDYFFVSRPRKPLLIEKAQSVILTHTTDYDLSDHNIVVLDVNLKSSR
jgi:endonuclease/exonuclease/phosphatase family metal-dependent hydrolase